ncbi:MAG: NIF family HAD-type phosphatase [Spirochaetota bacterium]
MVIVFDMDNTLTDDFGIKTRPGMKDFLQDLRKEKHQLVLWTNSTKDRALAILKEQQLYHLFDKHIFREDYDPQNIGIAKDIRKVKGDMIIDDSPEEIAFARKIKKKFYQIEPYRLGHGEIPETNYEEIYSIIQMNPIVYFFKERQNSFKSDRK